MAKSISIFFPCYNEEDNIERVVKYALSVLENITNDHEVIIVNDASTDRIDEIADKLSKNNKHVRVNTSQGNGVNP